MKITSARISLVAFTVSVGLTFFSSSEAQAVDQQQLFAQTKIELQSKVSEQTLNDLQALVRAEPTNSQAHLNLGLVLDQLGLTEPAAEQFELAVKYGADNPDTLVQLCKEEIKVGRVPAAMGILNEGIKKFPNNAEMLYMIGEYLWSTKNNRDATALFEKAYQIDPKVVGLSTALGRSVIDNDPLKAANLAAADLKVKPNDLSALLLRGMAYRALGRNREAVKDLQRVFDSQPLLPAVSDALATGYYWLGDYEKALKPAMFYSAVTVVKDVEHSGNLPGLMRILIKMPRDKVLDAVGKLDIELALRRLLRPEFSYFLGKAFDGLNMPHAAMQQYSRSIAMDHDNARAYYRLALDQEIYLRDYEGALANYQIAYNQRPFDSELTVAYMRMQDRLHNRKDDIAWRFKDWFNKTFNLN